PAAARTARLPDGRRADRGDLAGDRLRRERRPLAARRRLRGSARRLAAGCGLRLRRRAVRRRRARADARRDLAAPHRDRLLVRPPARAARSGARARAARGRRGRHRLRDRRIRADAVPARRARADELAAAAPGRGDDPARLAARAAGLRARAAHRAGLAAAGPAPPPAPRLHDRRPLAAAATVGRPMTGLTPPEDRRPPITPQLAMRVAIIGGFALAMFAIVFFRLWFLQVLSGDQYLAQASTNRVRDISIQAPRGEMLDRTGRVLVEDRRAVAVVVSPPKLPSDPAARTRELARLSRAIGASTRPHACRVGRQVVRAMDVDCLVRRGVWNLPYADVTVSTDVHPAVYDYLGERAQEFPGVSIETVFLRSYPHDDVGAQLFGTVGQISSTQLKNQHFKGVRGGTVVGQSGLEYTYDHYLRGIDGATRVQVDALGQAKGYLRERAPVQGEDLRLSIDLGLEREGQKALETGIGLANSNGNPA